MAIRIRNGKEEQYSPKTINQNLKICIKMNDKIVNSAKQFAADNNMSFSKLIRESLIKYMEEKNGTLD